MCDCHIEVEASVEAHLGVKIILMSDCVAILYGIESNLGKIKRSIVQWEENNATRYVSLCWFFEVEGVECGCKFHVGFCCLLPLFVLC